MMKHPEPRVNTDALVIGAIGIGAILGALGAAFVSTLLAVGVGVVAVMYSGWKASRA